MQFTPTNINGKGTGYYRGNDGEYYYGNPSNGYLTETRETRDRRVARENKAARANARDAARNAHYRQIILDGIKEDVERPTKRAIKYGSKCIMFLVGMNAIMFVFIIIYKLLETAGFVSPEGSVNPVFLIAGILVILGLIKKHPALFKVLAFLFIVLVLLSL